MRSRRASWHHRILSRGFRLPAAKLQIFARDRPLRGGAARPGPARRSAAKAFLSDLRDLKVGDLVVHGTTASAISSA